MGLKSAICGIVAFIAWVLQQCGIDFGADAQAHFSDAILNIVQGVGMIAVIGGELWSKWKNRKKGLQLLCLGLACLICLSGCALHGLEKHEQALIVSDQVSEAYLSLRESYVSIYEAFPGHRQELRFEVAPKLDAAGAAIVALREAALAWATVKEKPGSWPEAFDAAVRAVASASEAIDTIRKEAAS